MGLLPTSFLLLLAGGLGAGCHRTDRVNQTKGVTMEQRINDAPALLPDLADRAQFVFVGKVLQLGPSPGFVSGEVPAYQTVKLHAEQVLKGDLAPLGEIAVQILILQGRRFVGRDAASIPALDPTMLHPDARLLVYAQPACSGFRALPDERAIELLK